MRFFLILSLVALVKGEGTLEAAEQYTALLKGLYNDEEVAAAAAKLGNPQDYPSHYSPVNGEEFDFIVVGAGTAGSVVANRLSEIPEWKVLLIEAGGDPIKAMDVPALAGSYLNTEVDWQYRTNADGTSCKGMKNEQCSIPRGKVLGGTSNLNYMLHVRGNPRDYDRWADEGCTGWSFEEVLPYFIKSEDMRVQEVLDYSPGYHGVGGYQKLENYYDETTFHDYLSEAMQEVGYALRPDVNGKNQSGHNIMQGTLEDGRRCSAAKGFLSPVKDRTNLRVSKHSLVTKILIDERAKRATGVRFTNKEGETINVKSRKEVIVSGGTINSPQILMLSGIGPKKHLEELGIKVVADLPVGENFQDHQIFGGVMMTMNYTDPDWSATQSFYDFLTKKGSKFSNIPNIYKAGWTTTTNNPDFPECLFATLVFAKNDTASMDMWIDATIGYDKWVRDQFYELNSNSYIAYTMCSYLRPYSKGKIELKSSDPKVHPKITTGYFTDERDFDVMLPFYDFLENIANTDGMKKIDAKIHDIIVPECEKYGVGSREYRKCTLRYVAAPCLHEAGTCKMGPLSSPHTVVDPTLKVKGIDGLRVVDCSIMPHVTSSNTNAPALMIGEKASDMIKEEWLNRRGLLKSLKNLLKALKIEINF